jgi:glycine betaine/choline ABC-type transport system substrate-binding protein
MWIRALAVPRALAAGLALSLVLAAACTEPEEPEVDVVVGVGSTVEQQMLAALTIVALEHAGLHTRASRRPREHVRAAPSGGDRHDLPLLD